MPARSPLVAAPAATKLAALGERIRARRKALQVSAVDAAEAAGMSRVTLQRIERGEPSVTMGAYIGGRRPSASSSSSSTRASASAARGHAASRRSPRASASPTTRS